MASMSTHKASLSSSSSSSSFSIPRWKYDAFLSFRGEDTRGNFTNHLYYALKQKGIYTFRDDEKLERGKSISPELLKAIAESRFAIVIFSRNYASSTWCLDELIEIIGCMKEKGMTVLPVFYHVDPSDVKKQAGTFREAFDVHEERFKHNIEKVQKWRDALKEVANIAGWTSPADGPETKVIQEIVDVILNKLGNMFSVDTKGLVGINSRVEKLISHLDIGSSNVRLIGIWGLGGIGKTTLAEVVYGMVSNQFEACGFVANVREVSENIHGLLQLQKTLLNQLLKIDVNIHDDNTGVHMIKNRLRHKKILLVLDDVNDFNQLVKLAWKRDWFGSGSRVIITTRDQQLLREVEVDGIYEVDGLNDDEALQLLSLNAFKKAHPPTDYLELSKDVVNYVKGLPLAIEILGSSLLSRSVDHWKSLLKRLKEFPECTILKRLKIGFDVLHETERKMFLYIACFFNHEGKDSVVEKLDYLGLHPGVGLDILVDKSLVKMNANEVWMHDLLQEMGKNIVHDECPEDPGKRSRLWSFEDINNVLTKNTGTKAIQGMVLKLREPKEAYWRPESFSKLHHLELLIFDSVHLSHDPKHLPNSLRIIDWSGYPSKSFPSKSFERLKSIRLRKSPKLIETPDFTKVPVLEKLVLEDCINLPGVHPSIGVHKKLKVVSLKGCKNLKSLPSKFEMESLEILILSGCSKVKKIPEFGGNMECVRELYLDGTAITKLPASIGLLKNLKRLSLEGCKGLSSTDKSWYELIPFYSKPISPDPVGLSPLLDLCSLTKLNLRDCNLKAIPNYICSLFSLRSLNLNRNKLVCLPESIGQLSQLRLLEVHVNNLECLPESISQLSRLCSLDIYGNNLECLPESIGQLTELVALDLRRNYLICLPESIGQLTKLEELDLCDNDFVRLPESLGQLSLLWQMDVSDCIYLKSLPKLPLNIFKISVHGCESLEMTPDLLRPNNLDGLYFPNCFKLSENQGFIDNFIAFIKRNPQGLDHQYQCVDHNMFIVIPGSEIPEWFSHQSIGPEVNIKLHYSHLCNDFMGIALCAVFSSDGTDRLINWSFIVNGYEFGSDEWAINITTIASDHIFQSYSSTIDLGDDFSESLVDCDANGFCQIGIRFEILDSDFGYDSDLSKEVKKCGFRLLYQKDIEDPIPTDFDSDSTLVTEGNKVKGRRDEYDGAGPSGEGSSNDVPHPKRIERPTEFGNSDSEESSEYKDCDEELSDVELSDVQ